ncbi:MAG: hypothetical protein ABII90_13075 [Bacteroidota bacterium]
MLGCSVDESQDTEDDLYETIDMTESMGLDSGKARVFILPTPLQVASALKVYNIPYKPVLIDASREVEYYSNFSKSLNLGINTIDLGYATIYEDRQTSLNYLKNIEQLMNDLDIKSAGIVYKDSGDRYYLRNSIQRIPTRE